ncbi:MAG: hypothetical protein QM718_07595 [Steroidobacteraceae bacterium]
MSNTHLEPTDVLEAPDLFTATGTGRAIVDERGNSVWEWQTAPGVYSREISPQQFQALQAVDLKILDGAEHEHATLQHMQQHAVYTRGASLESLSGRRRRENRNGMLERLMVHVSRWTERTA